MPVSVSVLQANASAVTPLTPSIWLPDSQRSLCDVSDYARIKRWLASGFGLFVTLRHDALDRFEQKDERVFGSLAKKRA